MLGEAVRAALEFADVQIFSAGRGDLAGLVRWLRPSALIVDSEAGAGEAAAVARDDALPVLHVSVQDRALRLYRHGAWERLGNGDGPTPESIRNVLAGALFAGEVPEG
jgi:hypothetical protein